MDFQPGHIARVFDGGVTDAGQPYFVMELVEGESLEAAMRSGRRFTWQEVTDIGIQVSAALKHAHDHGVSHVRVGLQCLFHLFGEDLLTTTVDAHRASPEHAQTQQEEHSRGEAGRLAEEGRAEDDGYRDGQRDPVRRQA